MHDTFANQPSVEQFFDDIAVFTDGSLEEHLIEVRKCLSILQAKGFSQPNVLGARKKSII